MRAHPDPSRRSRDRGSNVEDWRGVGDLIAIATQRIATPVEGMHRAIVDRWLGWAGPRADPARRAAADMTALMYGTVRFGGSVAGATVSAASELASRRLSLPPVWSTSRGRYVQSILNGVWGDSLEDDKSPLRVELGLRDPDGNQQSTSKEALSRLFPNATSRLVVLVHGFAETERCWQPSTGSALPEGLEDDGFSVLRLRYNTGRAVADNGSELADLLEKIRQEWPVPVEEIVLVGHSMGGLVAQSAVIAALTRRLPWSDLATHIVAIGTPHLGSPIEKGVHLVGRCLGVFEVTRPLREFLEGRSAGIKDLRHGADNRPNGLAYHVVAGVVTKEPTHPLGSLVGDLVVRVGSAVGGDRTLSSNVLVVGGRQHADLPGDPDVASHIRGWLSQQSSGSPLRRDPLLHIDADSDLA